MAKTQIKASDFPTRSELEKHISGKYGLTTEPKDAEIVGTGSELKKLQLRHGSMIWGISCVATEGQQMEKGEGDIPRGKRTEYGINNQERPKKV